MMSSNVGEEVLQVISKALPGLLQEKKEQLLQRLLSWGVESKDDLKYVEGAPGVDLSDLLPPIQIRKLLDRFKQAGEQNLAGTNVSPVIPPPSSTATLDIGPPSPSSATPVTWHESFQIPWDQMPSKLRSAVANGKRPLPSDRRKMIRIIVDEIRKYEKNPSKAQCHAVAAKMVKHYPKSFSDFDDGQEKNEIGYYSLLKQIKTRVEHVNRNNTLARKRQIMGLTDTTEKMQCRGQTATYGCTKWQPEPPLANSDDVLEEKRQTLENLYQRYGKSGADRGDVCALMKQTYYLQRKHINDTQTSPIKDLKSKWPYLFQQKHMYAHFEELTNITIHKKLSLTMEQYSNILVDFFKSRPTNDDVKKVLSSEEEEEVGPLVIKLILAHFREDPDGLLLFADKCATAADIHTTLTIPGSPRLVVLGDTLSSGQWMLTIEGEVVCEGIQPTFLSGLATLFTAYYVFNLHYQEEAACTLEFIQRRFVGINPRGTKTSKGKVPSKKTGQMVQKKQLEVNPHVATLLSKLMDFQWKF
ncbi:uncharacterized protein LOC130440029 isoform X1 [Triplophysa dalaica]|uniref:uncharacterized protein LOC130414390 isoform X1 n=1 Tax=Triplophysa dalaica TaxID=1582913 RepID=UPI0024DFF43B|nr:uncharacterized protein LOC130414390 isoform X1 [Triplophysa dalaica]XP_056596251.1 uncharacterized protein LOC130414390 isoform X1 [Triplophysa dalaica]XP_056596258.1 uncharacterized protein LOC130414390 isoform X1 [Triplophysa dalaica]XP_056622168.1 uncharacterized protein LOC130435508 isoform X1 [Triplophysa dalaica]XP_056622169.1 uncharacterized protein LOC130435508 isoform X1 [Triplophysa dalaica]XP_056628784.1 uncharacterized protein LOC130440029 isoform X1 [Triplophysa dalaica]XP_05